MPPRNKAVRAKAAGEITLLLSDINSPESLRTLTRLVYSDLHHIAVHYSRREPPGHSLQPTALVHEAWIRLVNGHFSFENRRHFFGSAARTMRRIIVDSARRRAAQKRGGDRQRVDFKAAERVGFEQPAELLDLDVALSELARINPRWSEIVELRVFGGWSNKETATILRIGESTARRKWAQARGWLRKMIASRTRPPAAWA